MSIPRLLPVGLLVTAAAVAAAAPPAARGPAGMAAAGAPAVVGLAADVPDPFPIARLRVTPAQVSEAAKAFAPGPITKLTRAAFEEKVLAAGRAVQAAKALPHVTEAKYTASGVGSALAGTAEWTITHPGRGPSVLPLDPLKVALRGPVWADGSPATVGAFAELPGGGVGVWVPGPGRHVLKATWTAAGAGPAAERAFDLRFPACPASALDLDLPDDRSPAAAADVLVTGPLPGAPAGQKRWRLRFGEKGRVDLAVRGPADAGGTGPVVFAAITRYDLAPGEVACEFDFDLRSSRLPAAEWAFALSPGLRVSDVTVNNRAGWRVDPATRELRVTLRQPAAAAKVRVTAAAPLPSGPGAPVPLPTARPVTGLATDEKVSVHLAPGLDLVGWDAGDYLLNDAAGGADGGRQLMLAGTLLPAGSTAATRRPPAARVADGGPVFATTETVTWTVEAGRPRLTARVRVKVRRGPLFRLAVRPPPGFEHVRTTTTPADLLAFPDRGPAGAVQFEFTRPLAAGQGAELLMEFRGEPLPAERVVRQPFPAVGVVGAAERDGTVALHPGPGWEAFPHVLPGLVDETEANPFDLHYRGPEPGGELLLSAVRPTFASSVITRFDLSNGRLGVTSVVRLDVTAGLLGGVAVFEPGPLNPARTWKVTDGSNTVAAAVPVRLGELPAALALLGRPGGLGPVAAAAAAGRGEPGTHWLVRFSRPADDDLALETTASGAADASAASRLMANWEAGTRGLIVRGAAARVSRTNAAAIVGGNGAVTDTPVGWGVGELTVSTHCGGPDQFGILRGVVTSRGGRELPVALPTGAAARAASVGGKAVDPVALAGEELRLPVPAGDEPVAFEVRYRLPRESRGAAWVVVSPLPEVAGATGAVRREWVFGPGVSAAWPFAVRSAAGSAAEEPGTTRSDFAGEAVTVLPDRLAVATGVGLAAFVAGFGWLGVRTAHRSAGFALLTLAAGGGVAVTAGAPAWAAMAWPVLAASLPAAAAVVVSRGRLPTRVVAAVGVFFVAGLTTAQPAGPDVVLLVAEPGGEVVYAPPALLDRLEALAKPAVPASVIDAANYDGRAEDGLARVTATFAARAFAAGESAVTLPLADGRLERVIVDGKAVNPATLGGGRYAVPLPGPGRHAVEVRFAVPVAAVGAEREARFGVPEVPDARLTFAAPPAARQLQASGRLGEQKAGADPARVDAELGAVKQVTLRWREGPGGAGKLTVREGCVWEVTEAQAVLTACYDVRAESGTAAGFRFDLPPGLEPVRVAARGLDTAAGPVAVQAWTVGAEKNGLRPLRVDLAAPADGRVLVTIECHNRTAPTRTPVLRFPRPVGMESRGAVYGFRSSGVLVERLERSGGIDFPADVLVREFGNVPELRLAPGAVVQALSPEGGAAEFRPVLRAAASPGTVRTETTWAVDLRHAVGSGTVTWAADAPAALLEFALAARVREVRSPDLAGWAQAGDRVQVWFRKPVTAAVVEWVAESKPQGKGDAVTFEPPVPHPLGPAAGAAVLRVRPADGVGLRVEHDKGWTSEPAGEAREWAFRAVGAPPVRVQLAASHAGPASGFGLLDLTGKEPIYRVSLEIPFSGGHPLHAVVRVSGLPPGASVSLEPPPEARVTPGEAGKPDWETGVDVPAPAGSARAAVAIRLPPGWTGVVPVVWAGGGADASHGGVVRFLGRTGRPDVRLTGAFAAAATERAEAGAQWPGELDRLRRTGGDLMSVGRSPVELLPPTAIPAPAPPQRPAAPPPTAPAPSAAGPLPGTAEAAGWVAALLAVGVLFARFPRATWPEQAAALAALFGHAVAGVAGVGLGAYLAARGLWLADRLRRRGAS